MANAEKTTGASARVVIEAENIVKNYGHLQALRGASLKVYAGEVTALLGDNGAGKSTLANIISGAIPRTSGRLLCNGKEIDAQSIQQAQDMGIQTVYQDLALAPDLNVPCNIFLGREIIKQSFFGKLFNILDMKQMEKISREHLAELGIGLKSMTVPVKSLSGGERQRISIARALLKDAPIVLLDEATASLDVENETRVQGALSRLLVGKTVLVIAHRMRTVEAADKIIVLADGRVAEEGTPAELMNKNGLYHRMVDLQRQSAGWRLN
mgnify:CR=1 FL=1